MPGTFRVQWILFAVHESLLRCGAIALNAMLICLRYDPPMRDNREGFS